MMKLFDCFRNYITSEWCREEFKIAHAHMVMGEKKFLIPILKEPIDINAMPDDLEDLKVYLRTYTYIDATKYENNRPR